MIVKSIFSNSEIMVYSDIESALGKSSLLFVNIKNHDLIDIHTNTS